MVGMGFAIMAEVHVNMLKVIPKDNGRFSTSPIT
jgi:hypothetical protein